jgi:hypothetical protein
VREHVRSFAIRTAERRRVPFQSLSAKNGLCRRRQALCDPGGRHMARKHGPGPRGRHERAPKFFWRPRESVESSGLLESACRDVRVPRRVRAPPFELRRGPSGTGGGEAKAKRTVDGRRSTRVPGRRYIGQSTKLRDTMVNLIMQSPQTWHTSMMLPFTKVEGTVVEWDVRAPHTSPRSSPHAVSEPTCRACARRRCISTCD